MTPTGLVARRFAPLAAAAVLLATTSCSGGTSADVAAPPVASAPGSPSGTGTLTAPAGSTATVRAVWEALMGPDGEYAAQAQYAAVLEKYGQVEPFVSIERAESHHADALVRQLQRLGVEAPENPWVGTVEAPDDLTEAARAWADGEVANVALYDDLLAEVADDPVLTRVFTNLRDVSERSHLPLFRAAAENGGTLTLDQMAQIAPVGGGPGRGRMVG